MPKPAYTIKPCKHPTYRFVVRSKDKGRWVRKFFETHGEAKTYVEIKTVELMNQGREAVEFPSWLRVMAQQAHEQLEPFGKTIADAVAYFLPHLKAHGFSTSVPPFLMRADQRPRCGVESRALRASGAQLSPNSSDHWAQSRSTLLREQHLSN